MKRSMPWFRFYAETLSDPKVQRLSPELFKAWVNLLCLASQNDGSLPSVDDIAFHLRLSASQAAQQLDDLVLAGLIDIMPDGALQPHNWHVRQYASDSSTERVRKHREKRACNVSRNGAGNVSGNVSRNVATAVSETPPDTETDTDTDPAHFTDSETSAERARPPDSGQGKNFDLDGVGLGSAVDEVHPETLRAAARSLGIADASPLLPAFEQWPKSRTARDRNALFLATAPTLFERAKPAVRAACQPLAELAGADPPKRPPRCSPQLTAQLRKAPL